MPLSHKLYLRINRTAQMQARLTQRARLAAAAAQQISNSEGGEATFSVEPGVRPGGRAYTNIVSSSRDEEYGTETTPRIRALGRAVRATK